MTISERTEPEVLLDAESLVRAAGKAGLEGPDMIEEVRDILDDCHRIGSAATLAAARIVSRRFCVVLGGRS
jgi:hypothetical protein